MKIENIVNTDNWFDYDMSIKLWSNGNSWLPVEIRETRRGTLVFTEYQPDYQFGHISFSPKWVVISKDEMANIIKQYNLSEVVNKKTLPELEV